MSLEPHPKAADIGWKLARAREEKGLTREHVSIAIHLRKHYVDALEMGAFDALPGTAYARGYLNRYADFLELDAADIIAEFDAIQVVEQKKFFSLPQTLERSPYPSMQLVVGGIFAAFILMIGVGISKPAQEVKVVKPFVEPVTVNTIATVPRQCNEANIYPPCFWEDTTLWYRAYRPDRHIFGVEK